MHRRNMEDLLKQISEANANRETEALSYRRAFRKQDAIKKRQQPPSCTQERRHAFRSQVNTVGGEFHPVLRLKPKILDVWTAERCVMPARSYTVGATPLRMHHTPEYFPEAPVNQEVLGKAFLEFLEGHERERLRHIYPILFEKLEIRPPEKSGVSLDPFRNAVSKVSRDIQLIYPYQSLGEKKKLMRGKAVINANKFFYCVQRICNARIS